MYEGEYKLTSEEIRSLVEDGVKKAFKDIGLGDDNARKDVRELRDLLFAFRNAKRTIWNTVWTVVTTAIITGIFFWTGIGKAG